MGKVDVSGYIMIFIGVFLLMTVVNALFSTTNTAVTTLNSTFTTAGYTNEGNLLITGFQLVLLTVGLGMLIVGVAKVIKDAKRI